jgi:malate synthase
MNAANWNARSLERKGVVIRGAMRPGYEKVLTPEAIDFAVELEREFGAERRRFLARRAAIQRQLDAVGSPISCPRPRRSATANGR